VGKVRANYFNPALLSLRHPVDAKWHGEAYLSKVAKAQQS
jgi:hypothetical protein